jgi:hypothetical protein
MDVVGKCFVLERSIHSVPAAAALTVALFWSGCGKPDCTGEVTADLGADGYGHCPSSWIHGEKMCPQTVFCGFVIQCMAFADSAGGCSCPLPYREMCCPLSIVSPENGAILSDADDVDHEKAGLQVQVILETDCAPFKVVSICGTTIFASPGGGEPETEGRTPYVLDLADRSGCLSICAGVSGMIDSLDSIEVCIP